MVATGPYFLQFLLIVLTQYVDGEMQTVWVYMCGTVHNEQEGWKKTF